MPNLTGQSFGRYHILEQLGEGGMATVYKAYDTRLERDVAFKILRTDQFPPAVLEQILTRFEREAKALARLTHPNIVHINDYGEQESIPYLVMDFLPGGMLKRRLGQPIPLQEAVRLLIPVSEALGYAHEHGIIHRDVKPSNILLTEKGQPMLTDFGIAKILESDENQTLTASGVGIGTPEYMAPEQMDSKKVDQRADIYALGIVFYEMLTGRRPFEADTPLAVLVKQASEPLPRPTQFVPSLPEAVEKVLFKALAKKPEDRYQSMGELTTALERLTSEQTIAAWNQLKEEKREQEEKRKKEEEILVTLQPPAKHRQWSFKWGLWAAIGGLVVLVTFGIGIFSLGQKGLGPLSRLATDIATFTSTFTTTPTFTPTFTHTPTFTRTPTMTATHVPTFPPNLSLGSTWTRPADGMVMVFVPEGDFNMGSNNGEPDESPNHKIYVDSFFIDRTEVTNGLYALCVAAGKCNSPNNISSRSRSNYYGNLDYSDYPVIYVSWYDAQSYCDWVGSRLPTEAEWEKAARGIDGRNYPWGNNFDGKRLNYCDSNCPEKHNDISYNDGYADTAPVGTYLLGASPYGALDMAGNVWEWVADWYSNNYYATSPSNNPQGPSSGEMRVFRGGAWYNSASDARTSYRTGLSPYWTNNDFGFRCAQGIKNK